MYFYLDFHFDAGNGVEVRELEEGQTRDSGTRNVLYLRRGKQRLQSRHLPWGRLIIMGDPVFRYEEDWAERLFRKPEQIDEDLLYEEVMGHYYWFFLGSGGMCCGSSFGAVFPVYYHRTGKRSVISSSSFELAEGVIPGARDQRNLLERFLFNYPFFNSTWWTGIKLLDAHRYLKIGPGGMDIRGDFDLSRYFGSVEDDSREGLKKLAVLFREEICRFFPDAPFGISLTGGFVGRTLVAAARNAGREFFTYSFGRPGASDIVLPAAQSQKLGIPYLPLFLDRKYLEEEALQSAFSFLRLSEYNGNLGRPHYHYATEKLAKRTDYILTGNFGSELFRAMHLPGVMMSRMLIRLFSSQDDSWKDALADEVRSLHPGAFDEERDALISDLEGYLAKMQGWEANHRFYFFIFNEIFRKYFGPELIMQHHYFNNRTPYLNLSFFRALNRTVWAGLHSRLFEKKKNKRLKGQMFYATFIKETDRPLYRMGTNKGYGPADLLDPWRLPMLAGKVLLKKISGAEEDENNVAAFFQGQHELLLGRIQAAASHPVIRRGIDRSVQEIPRGERLAEWIKFYSIAAGWEAAEARLNPIVQ